ncbi:MAG: hypothetical protein ABSF12_04695 [Bryobacteraceae bacterium]|jgi:hypothetical protein
MKKIMSAMLGLSLLIGATSFAFGQSTTTTKKMKKTKTTKTTK